METYEKREGAFNQYQEQIDRWKKDATFVKPNSSEIDKLKVTPHHFMFHSVVCSLNSGTTKIRLVDNTSRCVPGKMATISTEQVCPCKTLNSQVETCIGTSAMIPPS